MRKESGISSPCLVCFHEGSHRKEKMSQSPSTIPYLAVGTLGCCNQKRAAEFEFVGTQILGSLAELFAIARQCTLRRVQCKKGREYITDMQN